MEKNQRKKYDAIIIGAGHNGLVSSIILANNGLKVLVLEATDRVGGMASTTELWKGYKVPLGAYVVSLFNKKLLEKVGIREKIALIPKEPGMTVFLEDKKILSIYNDTKKTVKELSKYSENDATTYIHWANFWNAVSLILETLYNSPPLEMGELIDVLRRIQSIPFIGEKAKRFIEDLVWAFTASASRFLDEYFEASETKASLVEDALVGELVAPSTPGSALILVHHYFGNVTGNRGQWAYIRGGIGKLAEALLEQAIELGVNVKFNSPVKEIVVKDDIVQGVLTDNTFYEAENVISTINVKTLFLNLIQRENLDRKFVKRIENIRAIGASYKLLIARKGLPKLRKEYEEYRNNVFSSSTIIMPTIEYAEKAFGDALSTGISKEPWMSINTQSYVDDSIAPNGHHVISIFAQYVKSDARKWNEEDKNILAENTLSALGEYFEDFLDEDKKTKVLSPLDFEQLFLNPGGNIFQINMNPEQIYSFRPLPECANYATPIKNLYIAGSSAHPGGGITGLPGYLGAIKVLKDKKILSVNKEKPLIEVLKEIITSIF